MKRRFWIVIILLLLLLAGFCVRPILICSADLPEPYLLAVRNDARGFYSSKLPLVPLYVTVDGFSDRGLYYTIHYFPFGSVGMSYLEGDGYNTEKPLSGLS